MPNKKNNLTQENNNLKSVKYSIRAKRTQASTLNHLGQILCLVIIIIFWMVMKKKKKMEFEKKNFWKEK